ncbi:MAG TPA: alpha/beta hydrolase [Candidatus Binataceae bacterium]|nr:alpha/beta hydrolase [Candidatus Binataceae bacterium]
MSFAPADRSAPEIMRLGDGRRFSFAQYGDPRGRPLLYFHGMPGSRHEGAVIDAPARGCGLRVIAPDRPGMGESDFKRGRTLLGWAADIAELAGYLGVRRFGVAGTSGGGPYALAAAYALADRLDFAADIAGWGPLGETGLRAGFGRLQRVVFRLADHAPFVIRALFMLTARAARRRSSEGYRKVMDRYSCAADKAMLADSAVVEFMVANQGESFRQGSRGPALDALLIYRGWGFAPEQITIPVHFFHGTTDQIVPFAFSRYLAQIVPGATLTAFEGQGHLCMIERAGEIVRFLARAYRPV